MAPRRSRRASSSTSSARPASRPAWTRRAGNGASGRCDERVVGSSPHATQPRPARPVPMPRRSLMVLASQVVAMAILGGCQPAPDGLLAPAEPGKEGGFGSALVLSDPILFVGEPLGVSAGIAAGVVSVFERHGVDWELVATIASPTAIDSASFGSSLAFHAEPIDTLVVGPPATTPRRRTPGAAFVFERDRGGNWTLTATLTARDPGWGSSSDGRSAPTGIPSLSAPRSPIRVRAGPSAWRTRSSAERAGRGPSPANCIRRLASFPTVAGSARRWPWTATSPSWVPRTWRRSSCLGTCRSSRT